VISDLHLGGRFFHGVLTRPEPAAALHERLADVDRLVLLGDIVELAERRPARAMAIAEPVLRAIGRRLGREREVVIVPGNHDLALVRPWLREVGSRLGVATPVPLNASPALAALGEWLSPARVSVSYPGVWLADGLYATHGHYLDVHLRPVSSYGIARGNLRRPVHQRVDPFAYERARRRPPQPRTRSGLVASRARSAITTEIKERVLRPPLAPLTSALLRAQMHHASLPAIARVIARLGIHAETVVFGHVHRLGPLPDDPVGLWRGLDGHQRLFNSGAWLYEPLLVTGARPPHPHWPGGAIALEPGQEPRPVGLLDHLAAPALRT
jgi:predicted phosphodiesterase